MKKVVTLSFLVASLFAADYQLGAGFGRSGVDHSPIDKYNFGNIRIGKFLPKNHILRLEAERSTSVKTDKKGSLNRLLLNVEHYFNTDTKFTPYAFIGTGYQWIKNYKNSYLANLGIGSRYMIKENLNLFVEARAIRDFKNNDNHYGILGGIVYNFGTKKEMPKTLDSDRDGVADNLDKCPNTPSGVKVDINGCAVDSDKDGVADYLDKCPNTPNGMVVDKSGCAIEYKFNITFDTNKADIKPEFIPEIKKFAEFLKAHPNVKAEIQGYTDNRGNSKYNLALSKKRAKAVYDALIKLGVNPKQLTWAGYGSNNNIASNNTSEGREQNRRVIAKIIY